MIKLISCIGIDYDIQLLPHFIKHYSKLDIDTFHFIIHSNFEFDINEFRNTDINLKLEKWVGEFDGVTKTNKLNKIIEQSEESHIVLADVDEFQIWETPLKNSNVVWGRLRDRESKDRILTEVTEEDLLVQFPLITDRTKWTDLDKPCLFPSSDRLLTPHHLRDNYNTKENLIDIDHFRWINGRIEKSKERKEIYRKLNERGIKLEGNIWKKIPNWESNVIIGMYKDKTLL